MNRKFLSVISLGVLMSVMTACGSKDNGTTDSTTDSVSVESTLDVVNDSMAADSSAVADTVAAPKEEKVEEEKPALPDGVVAEGNVPGFGKVTFKKGGKYAVNGKVQGTWKKVGKALEFHPNESTLDYFILDGRVYEGSYNAKANTRSFEFQNAEGDLDDKTVKVTPKDGKKVTDFVQAD